ncbi:melanoregulin isoform X2 [Ahaetulla prasina]|uniref:melanoregulin isoform X2 n=1 Tax=Ahaetulla prasina TaxID=499056 RepID=UPI002648516F|nr:melanoregulin isoform X2 [Ahaetulla prasina]
MLISRKIRRKVKDRWKHILEVLGFKAEADGLLTVTSCTSYESLHNPQEARRLHTILAEQTSIFGHQHGGPPERYLFVLDRLILLDVGDDFLSAARHFYPAEEEDDNMSFSDGGPSTPGPVLIQLNNEIQKEAEVEEGEELKEDYTHFEEAKGDN